MREASLIFNVYTLSVITHQKRIEWRGSICKEKQLLMKGVRLKIV
jgi:hypothetical protein